jgi:hypothetical protein
MELLLVIVGGLLGITGVILYIIKLFGGGSKAPIADSKPYVDFINTKLQEEAKAIDAKAADAQKKLEEELKNATDQEVINRFHDVFSKPVPGSDGLQTTTDASTDKPAGPKHP